MPEITITLDEKEQEALRQLIDAALRQAGEGALDVAAHFKAKVAVARARAVDAAQQEM
jgi:hypothetical protein